MNRLAVTLMGVLLAAVLLTGCGAGSQTEVTTACAKSDRDLSDMTWQGTAEALETITILPEVSGKVAEIQAVEGQHVEAGAVIFLVDQTNAKLQLDQALASYQAAEAAFHIAENAQKENTSVAPAEIAYTDAFNNYNRAKLLYDSGDLSQVDYETAKSRMDTTFSQLQAAQNNQSGNFETAQAQLAVAKAALDIAQKHYDDCSVTSPISGMVTSIDVKVGEMVGTQTAAATVIDDSGARVEIQVADTDIGQLSEAMPMDIAFQSVGKSCTGKVSEISPVCDAKTGMFRVKILLGSGEQNEIWVGLAADVKVSDSEPSKSVYIPAKCIQTEDGTQWVYAVSDGRAVKKEITIGKKKNAYMEVTEGLNPGDEVVMQSSHELKDGTGVRVLTVK